MSACPSQVEVPSKQLNVANDAALESVGAHDLLRAKVLMKFRTVTSRRVGLSTGVNPAGDAGDTSPPIFWLGGDVNGNIPANIITYFWI